MAATDIRLELIFDDKDRLIMDMMVALQWYAEESDQPATAISALQEFQRRFDRVEQTDTREATEH